MVSTSHNRLSLGDVSSLLFSKDEKAISIAEPLIGPIRVDTKGVVHGKGLVATRDILAGDCLFVINPAVSAPIHDVRRVYASKAAGTTTTTTSARSTNRLEQISETILLKHMKRALKKKDKAAAASFMMLTSGGDNNDINHCDLLPPLDLVQDSDRALHLLLGRGGTVTISDGNAGNAGTGLQPWWNEPVKDSDLLQIVRRNAFGPDFYHYDKIESTWSKNDENRKRTIFHRILGMYPLGAILNHSCQPNALRVFCGEVMLVFASRNIAKGEEVVWSYIPPTQPYERRQSAIQNFGFTCLCRRCESEKRVCSLTNPLSSFHEKLTSSTTERLKEAISILEDVVLGNNDLTNETKRFIRLSSTNLYMDYFNMALQQENPPIPKITKLATQLHFSFAACHNACTEHISILHLCYELSARSNDMSNVKFWTDQLKRAHMVRYGKLGNNIENVRRVMKHTRLLRRIDGIETSEWNFL